MIPNNITSATNVQKFSSTTDPLGDLEAKVLELATQDQLQVSEGGGNRMHNVASGSLIESAEATEIVSVHFPKSPVGSCGALGSEALPQFGITAEALASQTTIPSRRNRGHVSSHVEAIRNAAPQLIEQYGTPMLTAKPVFEYLKSNDLCQSAAGQSLQFANAVGDAMGKGGLNLPRLRMGGKLVFSLTYVNSSDQEKAEAQEALDNLTVLQKKAMKTA